MSRSEKMRKAKVQLELKQPLLLRVIKSVFINILPKKRTRKIFIPYGMWKGTLSPQMRKRLPSLPQSLAVRIFILRATSPLSWQTGTESRIGPPRSRRKWSVTCCATWALTDPWGWKGTEGTGRRAKQFIIITKHVWQLLAFTTIIRIYDNYAWVLYILYKVENIGLWWMNSHEL